MQHEHGQQLNEKGIVSCEIPDPKYASSRSIFRHPERDWWYSPEALSARCKSPELPPRRPAQVCKGPPGTQPTNGPLCRRALRDILIRHFGVGLKGLASLILMTGGGLPPYDWRGTALSGLSRWCDSGTVLYVFLTGFGLFFFTKGSARAAPTVQRIGGMGHLRTALRHQIRRLGASKPITEIN
jgi:hypothetical protein